jgi:DNA-nicking Smr family endonuclease
VKSRLLSFHASTPIGFTQKQFFNKDMDDLQAVEIPIDGVLDLHAFSPKDVKTLVPEYLQECRQRGILQVRIIHGKGTGSLRRTVHALLARMEMVAGFRLGDEASGGWGATLVTLRAEALPPSAQ